MSTAERPEDCDLIVLGTRTEGEAAAHLGSVSSAVVRSAARPLLLVPPRVWCQYASDPLP